MNQKKPLIQSLLAGRARPLRRPPVDRKPVAESPRRDSATADDAGPLEENTNNDAVATKHTAAADVACANLSAALSALGDADLTEAVGRISRADVLAAEQARDRATGLQKAGEAGGRSGGARLGRVLPLRKPPQG